MNASHHEYSSPLTIEEAVLALESYDNPVILAGGYDILPKMHQRRLSASAFIDLRLIPKLKLIEMNESGSIIIGSMATLHSIATSAPIEMHAKALAEAADCVGDVETRNSATIGGSIASGGAANDIVAALVALDAKILVCRKGENHLIPVREYSDFCEGRTSRYLIIQVELPVLKTKHASAYKKFRNVANHYPICGVAVSVTTDPRTGSQTIRYGITGATSKVLCQIKSEQTALTVDIHDCVTDMFASAEYRQYLADMLAREALQSALASTKA